MNLHEEWKKVLDILQNEVTAVTFDLWIDTLEPISYANDELRLMASSQTAKNQVNNRSLYPKIQDAVKEVFNAYTTVKIVDQQEHEEELERAKILVESQKAEEENKQKFDPKFTFDNFVVGKSNQFVYAAVRSVAENPSSKFNPLFIYGGVGLGKTHLMQAAGNYLAQTRPELNVLYVTCEKFMNDYVDAVRSGKEKNGSENGNFSFREKYRNTDVLMVDDIQFISNKMGLQEEFFHTFNDLYQNHKQILIASDRPPKEIATLEERLRSRFSSGLIQDIQIPDFETRVAILRKKAGQEGYLVEDEVIDYIASKSHTNIREMGQVLNKVVFYASLIGKNKATMDEVYEALKDTEEESQESVDVDKIIDAVCEFFKVTRDDLVGKKKSKDIVEPRQVCIYLINEMLTLPLKAIGAIFGGRDHTTVMHARDKITTGVKNNPHIRTLVNDVKSKILNN